MNNAPKTGLLPFYALDLAQRAKMLSMEGRPVSFLQTGEPAAPPAPKVMAAMAAALREPQGYTQSMGRIELRRALAQYYAQRHGAAVDPDAVVVTMGSSAGFILSFLGAFEQGATIAVTRPGYPAYLNTLAALGFAAVEIPLTASNGWRLTAADIVAAHRQQPFEGLLFASPANPTGAAVNHEQMGEIVATCRQLGVRLISDEIYHGLDYGQPSPSAVEFGSDAIIVNSFSKYYCMTGWRVGWLVLPPDLVRKALTLQQSLFIAAPTVSQIGAEVALGERDYYECQKAHYRENQQVLLEGLSGLGFGGLKPSDGAFYTYANVSNFTDNSMNFCADLLEVAGVSVAPGIDFDRVEGHRFVRFSYAGSRQSIEDGVERLGWYLNRSS